MIKRAACVLLALGLMLLPALSACASEQKRYESMEELTQDLYQNGSCLLAGEISYA